MSYLLPFISFSFTTLINSYLKGVANNPNIEIEEPYMTSTILISSLNEEPYIENCLQSIHNNILYQSYPDCFEIVLVDGYSHDSTVEIARPYVNKILFSPPGKLTARDLGTRLSNNDLIISIDADAVAPVSWLTLIHKNFKNPDIVALTGPTYGWGYLFDRMYGLAAFIIRPNMRLSGRNSAFLRKYYIESGGFNLNIDQQDVYKMVYEEEIDFAYKLSQFGKIKFDPLLYVTELTRRRHECSHIDTTKCNISDPLCRYCREIKEGRRFGGN